MYKVGRSRTPQGVRGLKRPVRWTTSSHGPSHSARSAWIETRIHLCGIIITWSHSARSAWIETPDRADALVMAWVALRKECVD